MNEGETKDPMNKLLRDRYILFGFLVGGLAGIALGLMALSALGILPPASLPPPTEEGDNLPTSETSTPVESIEATTTLANLDPTPVPIIIPTGTPTSTPLPPEGQAFSIGQSVQGREIKVVRFGSGPIVRMIIGAIHGGYEWNTAALVQKMIDELRAGTLTVPPDITLYILPDLNPDGSINFPGDIYGRANANGVDLNRNWDSHWQADWPRTGCFNAVPISAGQAPFSEPETKALSEFLSNNRVDALISYHSRMGAIFATGSSPLHPAADDLAKTLAAVSGYLYPPPGTGCLYTGQLVDWAVDHDIVALTIELTTHESLDLEINRKVFEAFLTWRRP